MVVSGTLDYSDPKVQEDMENLLQKLENTTYIDPLYTESWLRSFLDYVNLWKGYQDGPELNVDNEQSFIRTLRDVSIKRQLKIVSMTNGVWIKPRHRWHIKTLQTLVNTDGGGRREYC